LLFRISMCWRNHRAKFLSILWTLSLVWWHYWIRFLSSNFY
jgi:hypothetical protein